MSPQAVVDVLRWSERVIAFDVAAPLEPDGTVLRLVSDFAREEGAGNGRLQSLEGRHDLVAFEAHLKATSDTLQGSGYYTRFTPEMLRAVGMPR